MEQSYWKLLCIHDCIVREGEELEITDVDYQYIGLMHYKMDPGYFNPEWHYKYGALYGVSLPESMSEVIEEMRKDRDEINERLLGFFVK